MNDRRPWRMVNSQRPPPRRNYHNSTPYERPATKQRGGYHNQRQHQRHNESVIFHNLTQEEQNIERFLEKTKEAKYGHVVIIMCDSDHPYSALQNALSQFNHKLDMKQYTETQEYILYLDKEEFARGVYETKKLAKAQLGLTAIEKLTQTCFLIVKKKFFWEINDPSLKPGAQQEEPNASEQSVSSAKLEADAIPDSVKNSKAYQMMKNMGWGGKGLGAAEQGRSGNVLVEENVNRSGLGFKSNNMTDSLRKLLTTYSQSTKLTALAFSNDFTKEERETIHKYCLSHFRNLKTKSFGTGEGRYLTVSRKVSPLDMVRQLIREGLKTECYELKIPDKFKETFEQIVTRKE